MAKQTLNNGETGLSFRGKINYMMTELYDAFAGLLPATADAIADVLDAAPTTDPASLARIKSSVSGYEVRVTKYMTFAEYLDTQTGVGALDVSGAFSAAIAEANAVGGVDRENVRGATIIIPDGWYKITSSLPPVTVSGVKFNGSSRSSAVLRLSANAATFVFQGDPVDGWIGNCGIANVKIEYPSGPESASAAVVKLDCAFDTSISDVMLENVGTLLEMGAAADRQCSGVHLDRVDGSIANAGCPLLKFNHGAGFKMANSSVFVRGVTAPVHPAAMTTAYGTDFVFAKPSGNWDTAQFTNVLCERFDRAVNVYSTSGVVQNFYFTNFIADYNRREAVYLDAAGGTIAGFNFDPTSWYVSWEADAVKLAQSSGINDLHSFRGTVGIAGNAGVDYSIESATSNSFSGMKFSGCGRTGNNTAAMFFHDGAKGFTVTDCSGNQDATALGLPWRCGYGIYTGVDADDYSVTGNSLQGIYGGYAHAANTTHSSRRKSRNNNYANYANGFVLTLAPSGDQLYNTTPHTWDLVFSGGTITGGYDKNNYGYAGGAGFLCIKLEPGDFIRCGYSSPPNITAFVQS